MAALGRTGLWLALLSIPLLFETVTIVVIGLLSLSLAISDAFVVRGLDRFVPPFDDDPLPMSDFDRRVARQRLVAVTFCIVAAVAWQSWVVALGPVSYGLIGMVRQHQGNWDRRQHSYPRWLLVRALAYFYEGGHSDERLASWVRHGK